MKEMELQTVLKNAGWTLRRRNKWKDLEYLYAAKRIDGRVRETYIAPASQLEQLTENQVLEKLAKIK